MLVVNAVTLGNGSIVHVIIHATGGQMAVLYLEGTWPMSKLREQIQTNLGIPSAQQHLSKDGVAIVDAATIEATGLKYGDVILVTFKMANNVNAAAQPLQQYNAQQAGPSQPIINPLLPLQSQDPRVQEAISKRIKMDLINQNLQMAHELFPESFVDVVPLYISVQINQVPLTPLVDTGAQTTVMSKSCARKCGILDMVDDRFRGVAIGLGVTKTLGKVHMVNLQVGDAILPISLVVVDDQYSNNDSAIIQQQLLAQGGNSTSSVNIQPPPEIANKHKIDFLLGLDVLKRHQCVIDLEHHRLKLGPATVEFLTETQVAQYYSSKINDNNQQQRRHQQS